MNTMDHPVDELSVSLRGRIEKFVLGPSKETAVGRVRDASNPNHGTAVLLLIESDDHPAYWSVLDSPAESDLTDQEMDEIGVAATAKLVGSAQ